jgi:hypothetical protein
MIKLLKHDNEVITRQPLDICETLFPGDKNTGIWPSRLGESQMRQ